MQATFEAEMEPAPPIDASAAFMASQLSQARGLLELEETSVLAIIMPAAGADHADWRRALARDLAREYSPKRVNIISGNDRARMRETLTYLRNAPGVTGHYLVTDEGSNNANTGSDRGR